MEINKSAQDLLDAHGKKTERLGALIRATARTHYAAGVSDCLRLMQDLAVKDAITAPLAVQPSHSALTPLLQAETARYYETNE